MGESVMIYGRRRRMPNKGLYTEKGLRKSYNNLSQGKKDKIKAHYKSISEEAFQKFENKKITMPINDGMIEVQFTKNKFEHFVRDAYITLSGKYLTVTDIKNIDNILKKAEFVKSKTRMTHGRNDGKEIFYKYRDMTGRDIYFGIAYEPRNGAQKYYTLYSVTDR